MFVIQITCNQLLTRIGFYFIKITLVTRFPAHLNSICPFEIEIHWKSTTTKTNTHSTSHVLVKGGTDFILNFF